MKIEFKRTGGFAGLRLEIALDTEKLEHELAAELEELVHDSGFFETDATRAQGSRRIDRFLYKLRISSPARGAHELVMTEPGVPNGLLPLLTRLTALALASANSSATPHKTV